MIEDDDLLDRATRLWFGAAEKQGAIADQPNISAVEEHNGRRYVVLRNVRGILAAYRVRNDGSLKRLKRLPNGME